MRHLKPEEANLQTTLPAPIAAYFQGAFTLDGARIARLEIA